MKDETRARIPPYFEAHAEDQHVEQFEIGLHAELGWTVLALEESSGSTGTLLRRTKCGMVLGPAYARLSGVCTRPFLLQ